MPMERRQRDSIVIRLAEESDSEQIWSIFHAIVKKGDAYPFAPATTKEQAKEMWYGKHIRTYVAVVDGRVDGTYILKPNQPGLGSHVSNAAFMVNPVTDAKGIGTKMVEHALDEARLLKYKAMQFNFVVSTNERAIALWKRHGFSIIGISPKAYNHAQHGLVDVLIMHRFL